jgi:ATP-dependent Lon protease
MVHATGNIEKVMDESRKVASTAILSRAAELAIDPEENGEAVHLHFMGGSTRKDGPSAGGAIALALASLLAGRPLRRDVAMTGEIDTHGRITVVGGLDVKLEYASGAGCKTVIIPRENLKGPGGIERFPEPLRKELQVLSFEEWRDAPRPFDYTRHVLQVVAVDDIVQAHQVAVIDERELAAVEDRFSAHAREVAPRIAEAAGSKEHRLVLQVIKDAGDLHADHIRTARLLPAAGQLVMVPPELRAALAESHPGLERHATIQPFNLAAGELAQTVERKRAGPAVEIAVVAPFFLIKRERLGSGVRLFANNYAVQGVKLKGCKPLLSRACALLAQLPGEALDECPFLGRLEGMTVVDLSPIQEKYRLHLGRAEAILNRCLEAWLRIVEDQ